MHTFVLIAASTGISTLVMLPFIAWYEQEKSERLRLEERVKLLEERAK